MAKSPRIAAVLAMLASLLAAWTPAQAAPRHDFTIQAFLQLDRPIRPGDFAWNDQGVAPGPIRIVVDLKAALLFVYRSGAEIGRASILYGDDGRGKATPLGTFPILAKDVRHFSSKYKAPMPYALQLTRGGVFVHATIVDEGYATHGCVGVPEEFAKRLFANAHVGDLVTVTRGWPYGAALASR